jgi:nucleoside-diphosphate-sugar epimerase
MRLLITGGNGFLGSVVMQRLLERQFNTVRCLVRSGGSGKVKALQAAYPLANVHCTDGNLTSRASCQEAVQGVDTVLHLAAALRGSAADMVMNTVVASRNLLDAAVAAKVRRIVLVSSFAVYGAAGLRRRALMDESTPLEPHPEWRDPYAYAKLKQEQLFHEYQKRHGFELVVLRPGVIYGPGGGEFSTRVGIQLPGIFLHLGNRNRLPLTYVENCADAIILSAAARHASRDEVYNVVDDDLPMSKAYLNAYRKRVRRIRTISIPYPLTLALSHACEWYSRRSLGQLPAILTPYKSAFQWKGFTFSNAKLKSIGWQPLVSTREGLRRTFESFRLAKSQ